MWIKQTKMVINPSFLTHWPQPDIPLNILCGTALRPCFMTHWSKFLFTINTKKCAYINSLVGIKEVDVATLTSPIGLKTTVSKPQVWPSCYLYFWSKKELYLDMRVGLWRSEG